MSHGFQILNPDGSVAIDAQTRPPRLVFHERFPWDFVGSRHVPAFSDTKGFISVSLGLYKLNGFPDYDNADDAAPLDNVQPNTVTLMFDATALPTVAWTEATKTLDIAAASSPLITEDGLSPFTIFMVMYR